jgi:hypothetical protein
MSKIRPRLVVGKKDAERLGISPLTGASRPDFELDERAIRRACSLAGLPESEGVKMVVVTRRLTSDYLIERRIDGKSVAATEAHDLASRLEFAAADIREVLSRRLVSPFLAADIGQSLPHVESAAAELRRKAGEPRRGGGTKAKSDAQVEVAADLLKEFEANGWLMGTGPKSLMAEALRVCLEAGGTPHAHPDRILATAKRQLHD